jgi:hypothetical protein
MGHGACLVCAPTLMSPHRHESDGSVPDICPRCGELRLSHEYYCFTCGRQWAWEDWIP